MSKLRLEDLTEDLIGSLMTGLARHIDHDLQMLLDGRPQFCLLVFNDPKVAQYISNCERSSMVKALREAADRIESRQDLSR